MNWYGLVSSFMRAMHNPSIKGQHVGAFYMPYMQYIDLFVALQLISLGVSGLSLRFLSYQHNTAVFFSTLFFHYRHHRDGSANHLCYLICIC